jgi:hypothetical protein
MHLVVLDAQVQESRTPGLDTALEEILRKVPCPILIVGPRVTETELAKRNLERIVYVTDYTTGSLASLPYALALAEDRHRSSWCMSPKRLQRPFPFRELQDCDFSKKIRENGCIEKSTPAGIGVCCSRGRSRAESVRIAANLHASMIVMSARGNLGQLLWHRAGQVVCQAHCPVLIVRGFR